MLYDYETNLLIPKPIVILAKQFAGGVFELKRFHGAGGEEVLDEFSDGIYEVVFFIPQSSVECRSCRCGGSGGARW